MIVDTSAIMAILLDEAESEEMLRKITEAPTCRMSAGTLMELNTVVLRRHPTKARVVENLIQSAGITIEDVTLDQVARGRDGYRAYGRGARHRARLSFGDCFAYGLAKATGEPLLFKGGDFVHTDVLAA